MIKERKLKLKNEFKNRNFVGMAWFTVSEVLLDIKKEKLSKNN